MSQTTRISPQTFHSLPPRPIDGHKGQFGRVLVIGGSRTMLGAPVLAGTAALRLGSGLVQIAVPSVMLPAALSVTPELIGLAMEDRDAVIASAEQADAIVIGPGLGTDRDAGELLDALLRLDRLAVLDADALNLLAMRSAWPAEMRLRAVLTPHPGEMKRLGRLIGREQVPADDEGRVELAVQAANAFRQVMVLKGHYSVITDGQRVCINDTGDSSLSKAGSGDVLSGMIACLLAQDLDRFDAAAMAVRLHGRAGEIAGQLLGRRSVLVRDVIDAIPAAISDLEQHSSHTP